MDFSQLLDAEPFLGYLGMQIVEAKVDGVVLRLPLRRELTNHAGMIHGGAQYCLGEAVPQRWHLSCSLRNLAWSTS
ncbi:MAG: PaaI family thioesterase [Ktedonobacterales bacterium]